MANVRIWHPQMKRCSQVPARSLRLWRDAGWVDATDLDLVETTERRASVRTFELREQDAAVATAKSPAEEADNPNPTSEED